MSASELNSVFIASAFEIAENKDTKIALLKALNLAMEKCPTLANKTLTTSVALTAAEKGDAVIDRALQKEAQNTLGIIVGINPAMGEEVLDSAKSAAAADDIHVREAAYKTIRETISRCPHLADEALAKSVAHTAVIDNYRGVRKAAIETLGVLLERQTDLANNDLINADFARCVARSYFEEFPYPEYAGKAAENNLRILLDERPDLARDALDFPKDMGRKVTLQSLLPDNEAAHAVLHMVIEKNPGIINDNFVEKIIKAATRPPINVGSVKRPAIDTLGAIAKKRPDLAENILDVVMRFAEDIYDGTRGRVQKALGFIVKKRPDLADKVLQAVKKAAKDEEFRIRVAAQENFAIIVGERPDLAESVLGHVKEGTEDLGDYPEDSIEDDLPDCGSHNGRHWGEFVRAAAHKALRVFADMRPDLLDESLSRTLMRRATGEDEIFVRLKAHEAMSAMIDRCPDLVDADGGLGVRLANAAIGEVDQRVRNAALYNLGAVVDRQQREPETPKSRIVPARTLYGLLKIAYEG